jgi:O-antigen ligase
MKSFLIVPYTIFFLFAVYYAQDWLYTTGSILSQACIVLIILISLYYMLLTLFIKNKNNVFYNAWTLFVLLNFFGFIIKPDLAAGPSRDMFKTFLGCMLPFYPFYYFAFKYQLKVSHLVTFFLLMLPVIILQYYKNQSNILLESDSESAEVVNNIAYSFVSFLPTVFLVKKNRLFSGILMTVLILFIIQGAKRGAILAGAIGLIMYFYYQIKTIKKGNRIFGYITAVVVISGLAIFAYNTIKNNAFLLQRMTSISQGDTSGRGEIYRAILHIWYNCDNLFHYIFGYGFASSVTLAGDYAHNDWLELLSNFGLVGVGVYLFLFYGAVKYSLDKSWMPDKRIIMMTITMIWFFTSMFSMWYTSLGGYPQAILLGYLVGIKTNSIE